MSDVLKKYKNDRVAIVQNILEPSKVIEDRYRTYQFELKDGETSTGIILREDAANVVLQTGPADALIQTLRKVDISQRQPQASSVMPLGLLNSLSKEQILDLLAYLESAGGATQAHAH
jgi:putative heme-binding domain-containing protein